MRAILLVAMIHAIRVATMFTIITIRAAVSCNLSHSAFQGNAREPLLCFFLSQVQGLGTALKILFSGHEFDDGKFDKNSQFHLKRTEIVSLFNGFGR